MNTKLTLSIESQIIEDAKFVARNHGKSLSKLIEQYLKSLTSPVSQKMEEESKLIKLKGSFTDPKVDYNKVLLQSLNKKYYQG
jgi:hypothetical protein